MSNRKKLSAEIDKIAKILKDARLAGQYQTRGDDDETRPGEESRGKTRCELISPLLNDIVGKKCAWTTEQCHRFFEKILLKYCDAKILNLLLAVSGYGEPYSKLHPATKRRRAYQNRVEDDHYSYSAGNSVERAERTALTNVAILMQKDLVSGELKKFTLSLFTEEELLALDPLEDPPPNPTEELATSPVETLEAATRAVFSRAHVSLAAQLKGTSNWHTDAILVNIGDVVEYLITYRNMSPDPVDNVMIRDILPPNMEYVADSTFLYGSSCQKGTKVVEDTIASSGINVGSYAPWGYVHVRFFAKVVEKDLDDDGKLVNWACATADDSVFKNCVDVQLQRE